MRKIFLLITLILLLIGCSKNDNQDFYGEYIFEKVSYISPLSSSTADFIEEKMEGTKFIIEENLFKIDLVDNTVEISSPIYVKEEISNHSNILSDVRSIIGNEIECQYIIHTGDSDKTHWRVFSASNCLWIASYVDTTADEPEIIMYVYELSRSIDK